MAEDGSVAAQGGQGGRHSGGLCTTAPTATATSHHHPTATATATATAMDMDMDMVCRFGMSATRGCLVSVAFAAFTVIYLYIALESTTAHCDLLKHSHF